MKMPVPSRRVNIVLAWLAVLVALALGAWLVVKVASLGEENHQLVEQDRQSRADRAELFAEVKGDKRDIAALREQLRQLGEKPVVQPQGGPDDSGIVVVPGPRGASCIEEIGYVRCRGAKGTAGGQGPAGRTGAVGATGAPGSQGPQGDAGPAGPQGPVGPTGPQGPKGDPGTAKPGAYLCPEGQAQRGWSVAEDGTVTYECVPLNPGNPGGNP